MEESPAARSPAKPSLPGELYQRIVFAIAIVIVVARALPMLTKPRGDFMLHYGLGQRIIKNEFIYGIGFERVYPPLWAMFHAPATLLPMQLAEILIYPLGVAAMVALVILLKRLADRHWPLTHDAVFWSTALAILFAAPFLHRDLVELGVNSFLVLLTWLAIYFWIAKRDILGGVLLGLATALKCTPIAFIAYFFWKRQWKIAAASTLFTVLFTLLPITMMGPTNYWHTEKYWATQLWLGVSNPDPSQTVLGPDRSGNLSLHTALARYLIHLPYGSPARPETPVDTLIPNRPPEPLYFDVLTLHPAVAGKIIKLILLLIAAATAWIFRGRVKDRNDAEILWECAALSVALLLYSPLTWAQHCPAVLPAFYFIFRAAFTGIRLPRDVVAALIYFFAVICLLQSGLIGWRLSGLLDAYHLRNFALVGIFWAAVRCHGVSKNNSSPNTP